MTASAQQKLISNFIIFFFIMIFFTYMCTFGVMVQ